MGAASDRLGRLEAGSERQIPFRRRRFLASRRRRRLWLWLLPPFLLAFVSVAGPVAVVAWVLHAEEFRIAEMTVAGGDRIPAAWVEERLATVRGRHILDLELLEVETLVADHPWLRGVEVSKRLPCHLEIRILEREPAALLRKGSDLLFLDDRGEVIAPYDRRSGGGDFVLITAERSDVELIRGALAIANAWVRSGGLWANALSEVTVVGAGSFRVVVSGLEFPLMVNRDQLEEGLSNIERLLPRIVDRFPVLEGTDLRFARQIVLRPAVSPMTKG